MRTAWLLGAFVGLTTAAAAQGITVTPRFREGDEFRLAVIRVRESSSDPRQNARSTTNVDVRVLSVTAEGSTLEWTPGDTVVDNTQLAQNPVILAAANAVKGIRLHISLNANGVFAGLSNEAEIAPKLRAAVDVIMRAVMAEMPQEQRPRFEMMMRRLLSPTTLVASVTHDVLIYFGLNGVTLKVGEGLERNVDQLRPIGVGRIPTVLRVRNESATTDSAVFVTTTTYDKAALLQMARTLAEQSGGPVSAEELAKLPSIERDDGGRYVLDRAFGLMREVELNRHATSGESRRLDRWEIRLLKAPQR
jgi:hypothetical protein